MACGPSAVLPLGMARHRLLFRFLRCQPLPKGSNCHRWSFRAMQDHWITWAPLFLLELETARQSPLRVEDLPVPVRHRRQPGRRAAGGPGRGRRARPRLARRVLAVDPWAEAAHRLLVLAHLADGDHAGARAALDACHQALADLGAAPAPPTLALHRRLTVIPAVPARP
jgi:hypothetical protein